ncbi:MAG TPA: hypothetical protein DHV05_06750 [Acholeplasmataceae bacterium]|nr:hypothetical protein [Acholeplasmataceae bacterium]
MFHDVHEAIHWLEVQIKFKPKTDLTRMREALMKLDLDLSSMKKIHIAGTNGKGSVASYISHILIEAGYKVMTFTSPYLVRFNERIRLQMKEIRDDHLLTLTNQIYAFNEQFKASFGETLSFFELLTLMSLIYAKDQGVDVIVMEVGLGGLLDATNTLNYDLSLITSIGFDHMKQLGNTLESIASNKLGILKKGNHLITTVDPTLHAYFNEHVTRIGATMKTLTLSDVSVMTYEPLVYMYQGVTYQIALRGQYQILNSLLSIEAIHNLFKEIKDETIQKALKKTVWSGRLEEIDYNVFIDGAHNTHAIDALIETAKSTFKDHEIWVLFSALGNKDIKGMLEKVETFAKRIVVTTFPDPRFQDLTEVAKGYQMIPSAMNAIETLKKEMTANTILIITGSLHFIGFIKKNYYRTC